MSVSGNRDSLVQELAPLEQVPVSVLVGSVGGSQRTYLHCLPLLVELTRGLSDLLGRMTLERVMELGLMTMPFSFPSLHLLFFFVVRLCHLPPCITYEYTSTMSQVLSVECSRRYVLVELYEEDLTRRSQIPYEGFDINFFACGHGDRVLREAYRRRSLTALSRTVQAPEKILL